MHRSRASLLAAGVLNLLLLRHFMINPRFEWDTRHLISGARRLMECFPDAPCAGSQHFPLLQYVMAWPLLALDWSDASVGRLLAGLSTVAFFASLALWIRERERVGWGLPAMLAGPWLWYASSSFGEMLAAFLTVLFVHLCLRGGKERWVFASFVAAALTKEVAFPFLVLFGLERRPRRIATLFVATTVTVAIHAGFNWLRFEDARNLILLSPTARVPDLSQQASSALAIWLSPNGGLLPFWPAFGGILVLAFPSLSRWRQAQVALAIAGLTWGFSAWYAPLGWEAWGPRLMMPWTLAILYLALEGGGEAALTRLLSTPGRRTGIALVISLLTLPQLIVLFSPHLMKDMLFAPDPVCPRAVIATEGAEYYRCMNHAFWSKSSVLVLAFRELARPVVFLHSIAFVAGIWGYLTARANRA